MEAMFLFENVSDPIVFVDREFCIVNTNPGFQRVFGVPKNQAIGKRGCDLFKELDFDLCNDACTRVVERASEGKKVAVPNDHCPLLNCAYPILNEQGRLDKTMIIIKNMVAHESGEELPIQHDEDEVKNGMFSTICHDLASPLQVIKACTDVMSMELEDKDEAKLDYVKEMLQAAKRNERRLEEMVRTIRLIPMLEKGEIYSFIPVRPGDAIDGICHDFQLLLRENESLEWYVPMDLPQVMIDPTLLSRIFFNLLDNARRYIREGGRIVVSAQCEPDKPEVAFTVFDDGYAIPSEIQPRLFEKNSVIDLARNEVVTRRDHGWGLYFCRLAIEQFGGSISVESKEGWGTQFSFTIPVAPVWMCVSTD